MQLAQLIQSAVANFNEQTGEEDVGFRNNYSGRGMYGRECVGITGNWKHCQQVLALVVKADFEAALVQEDDDFCGMVDQLLNFKVDSMGHDIVLYWEDVEPVQEDDTEDTTWNESDGQGS